MAKVRQEDSGIILLRPVVLSTLLHSNSVASHVGTVMLNQSGLKSSDILRTPMHKNAISNAKA